MVRSLRLLTALVSGVVVWLAVPETASAAPVPARIARRDGTAWSSLGSGVSGQVDALVAHDGALYAGGSFLEAGAVPASRIARWDGTSWSPLGDSQVTGNLSLANNATAEPATVSGNTVIGALACFGNRPAPTDHGLPNTATGGKLGQCGGL